VRLRHLFQQASDGFWRASADEGERFQHQVVGLLKVGHEIFHALEYTGGKWGVTRGLDPAGLAQGALSGEAVLQEGVYIAVQGGSQGVGAEAV